MKIFLTKVSKSGSQVDAFLVFAPGIDAVVDLVHKALVKKKDPAGCSDHDVNLAIQEIAPEKILGRRK